MVSLKIYEEGAQESLPLRIFPLGEHVLGRGISLNCSDKRLSRRHAVLKIDENEATLTMIHQNPCSYIPSTTSRIQILKQNVPVVLNDGDKFAFVEDFWYRININIDEDQDPNEINSTQNIGQNFSNDSMMTTITSIVNSVSSLGNGFPSKRSSEVSTPENRKKIKTTHDGMEENTEELVKNDEVVEIHEKDDPVSSSSSGDHLNSVDENNKVEKATSATENVETGDDEDKKDDTVEEKSNTEENPDEKNSNTEEKSDEKKESDENVKPAESVPSASCSGEIRRERCWYGSSCYRKNVAHKKDFSHPGDSDYETDPKDDNRPDCPYGGSCYQSNSKHRTQFKHPSSRPAPKPDQSKQQRNYFVSYNCPFCPFCEHCNPKGHNNGKDRNNYDSDGDSGIF